MKRIPRADWRESASQDLRADLRAVVVAGSIATAPIPQATVNVRTPAAIHESAGRSSVPLDLTNLRFVYRLDRGKIAALAPRHGKSCSRRS